MLLHMTPGQLKVLTLLVRTGDADKKLARDLDITEAKVKAHIKTLKRMAGAGVSNRSQLILWALRNEVVPLHEKEKEPSSVQSNSFGHVARTTN